MVSVLTELNFVATAYKSGSLGLIAYATPNTELYNGERVSTDSAIVFFGITSPLYWTDEAVELFKNSVNWLTNDTDEDGLKDYMDFDIPNPLPYQVFLDVDGDGEDETAMVPIYHIVQYGILCLCGYGAYRTACHRLGNTCGTRGNHAIHGKCSSHRRQAGIRWCRR